MILPCARRRHQGHGQRLSQGHARLLPRGCDAHATSCLRWASRTWSPTASTTSFPIILAVATIRSPRTADFPETVHRPLGRVRVHDTPWDRRRCCCHLAHGSACADVKNGAPRTAVDVPRTIPRGCHNPSPCRPVAVEGVPRGPLRNLLRTVNGTVTTRPLRAPAVVEVVLTVCLPGSPPHHLRGWRRPIPIVRAWPSRFVRRAPPGYLQDRRHGYGASFTSRMRRRQESVTARRRGHPTDHPRGCDGPFTLRVSGGPWRRAHGPPRDRLPDRLPDRLRYRLRTILARVSTPFTGITTTSSVRSAQQPPRALGN